MGAYLSTPVTEKDVFDGAAGNVQYGGASMQGWRRNMEDAHTAVQLRGGGGEEGASVFGVFDGHGGSEVARFCQKYLAKELAAMEQFPASAGDALVEVFHKIDDMLRDPVYSAELEGLKNRPEEEEEEEEAEKGFGEGGGGGGGGNSPADAMLRQLNAVRRMMFASGNRGGGMGAQGGVNGGGGGGGGGGEMAVHAGSTAIVAVKKEKQLFVANAGDSRGVLCRGSRAIAMSEDHKPGMETERSRIVAAGGFLSDIAGMCRVNGNLNLSRAIGDLKYKANASLKAKDQIITAEPDIRVLDLMPEDQFFVLACDGVWDVMDNQQVVDFVSARLGKGKKLSEIGSELLDECLAPDPKLTRGVGCDNMTILIGRFQDEGSQNGDNLPSTI